MGGSGLGGGGGQGGCEWSSKAFVKIQNSKKKKIFFWGGGGVRSGGGVGLGGSWGSDQGLGWGWLGSKVLGRWVMWGMGDVNQE